MISLSLPRSRNTWGWSNGGLAPTHMNSCEPISMTGTPASLWKCGTTLSAIDASPSAANGSERNQREADAIEKPRTIPVVSADSYSPEATICPYKIDTIVSSERPFFRRGRCVVISAHYLKANGKSGFRMKRRRISTALAGVAVTCALGAAVWPHARDASLLLAAQDDPAVLAETKVSSALRNNQKMISDNIEQALANG